MEARSDGAHAHKSTSFERDDTRAVRRCTLRKNRDRGEVFTADFNVLLPVNDALDELIFLLLRSGSVHV